MSEKNITLKKKKYSEITKEDFFGTNTPPILPGGVYYLNLCPDEDFNRPYIALPTNEMEPISMTNMQRFVRVTSGQYSFWDIPVGISKDALSFAVTNEIVTVPTHRLKTSTGEYICPRNKIHPLVLQLIIDSAYRANNPSIQVYSELVNNIYSYCKHIESFNISMYSKVHKTSYKDMEKEEGAPSGIYRMEFEIPDLLYCAPVVTEKEESSSEVAFLIPSSKEDAELEDAKKISEKKSKETKKKGDAKPEVYKRSDETRYRMRIGQILKKYKTVNKLTKKEAQGIDFTQISSWDTEIALRFVRIYETHTEAAMLAAFKMSKSYGRRTLVNAYYDTIKQLIQNGVSVEHVYDPELSDEEPDETTEVAVEEKSEPVQIQEENDAPATSNETEEVTSFDTESLRKYIDTEEIRRHLGDKSTPSIDAPANKFSLSKMREFMRVDAIGQQNALMKEFNLSSKSKLIMLRGKILNELDARKEASILTNRIPHATKYFDLVVSENGPEGLVMDDIGKLVFLTDAAKYTKTFMMTMYRLTEEEFEFVLKECIQYYSTLDSNNPSV